MTFLTLLTLPIQLSRSPSPCQQWTEVLRPPLRRHSLRPNRQAKQVRAYSCHRTLSSQRRCALRKTLPQNRSSRRPHRHAPPNRHPLPQYHLHNQSLRSTFPSPLTRSLPSQEAAVLLHSAL
ncbi:uncharacterized protein K444DRAFT_134229 [Hyaloscypha bicolor E]|uniref:REJ domain-containing protein n=1 Tax=Hyaloscypha bicolor E TaxID=1095630 RepID=A0A2J6STC7_9HELO|nr:uncharacterized protein K444DRAFT_134229 [Hyaloscypha bicolor E]PMD54034.1 hypothetical protein K444DRAFT_134229 [Hyaloscypha bicolor E]